MGLRRYVAARLHRRLFVWFGLAIVMTAVTATATFRLFGDGSWSWHREVAGLERFMNGRFAHAWHDPAARRELAEALARDLEVGVRLADPAGAPLADVAMPARCRHALRRPVRAPSGAVLGRVELCFDHPRRHGRPWRLPLALAATAAVLWAIATKVARRISRPLGELTRVAREIGEGDLASRARLRRNCGVGGEVGELTEAVHEMAERIERQLRDQRELLAAVSHELRTPLTRMRLLLELARDGDPRKALDELDAEVVEVDALVGDLLASARVDFAALSPRALDPAQAAERALERAALPHARLELEGGAPGPLVADATLLARALAALLDNARKYGGPRVTLRLRPRGDRLAFEVADDGPGFAPGDEERVFQPFYRGGRDGPARDEPRGVGLGLALVRRIAEAHGGVAYARNGPDGGARVGLELPRTPRAGSAAVAAAPQHGHRAGQ